MLSKNKVYALKAFIQSRMSGKFASHINPEKPEDGIVIKDTGRSDEINYLINTISVELKDLGYCVGNINRMPDTAPNAYFIRTYYSKMVDVYEKWTKVNEETPEGDESGLIIESVLGLSLLTALHDEVGLSKELDYDFMGLLEEYENKFNNRSDIVFKMHKIASDIFDTIRKMEIKIPKRVSKTRGKKKRKK